MGKREKKHRQAAPRRSPWRTVVLGTLGLVAVATVGLWWTWSPPAASGGTARLALDREVIDLGYLTYNVPASAVFTLTNQGAGTLRITEAPQVVLAKGC